MDRKKITDTDDELNTWQPVADGLAALLLVVLLVVMLLSLYIVRTFEPEETEPTEQYTLPGEYLESYPDYNGGWGGWGGWNDPHDYDDDDDGGGGGGGGETTVPTEPTHPTEVYLGDEGQERAAVHVRVMDAETLRLIREAGVQFDLYNALDVLQVLNTYYPEKTEYRKFETTENGTFYLPEKLPLAEYYLHELTEPTGYDGIDKMQIRLEEAYLWEDPYVADVLLYPSRNIIRIQLSDRNSGDPVSGGAYDVFADGDVVTADGTLRYSDGQKVDTIRCDSSGYGESIELYLGSYVLRESEVPDYYAADSSLVSAVTEKKQGDLPDAAELLRDKTTITITLVDELYQEQAISGALFAVYQDGKQIGTIETDRYGRATLTNLEKNASYRVSQVAAVNSYRPTAESAEFYVDEFGLIQAETAAHETLTNRLLRVGVNVHDALVPGSTDSRAVAVYNSEGHLIDNWADNGIEHIVTGLYPGTYELRINDRVAQQFLVEDTAELQPVRAVIWSATSIGILLLLLLIAVLALVFGIRAWNKRALKKRGDEVE